MKKVLLLIAAGALAVSASADLTSFQWVTGTSVVDNGGTTLATGDAYVLSVLDSDGVADIWADIFGGKIDIADLASYSEIGSSSIIVASTGPAVGKWTASEKVIGTGSWVGSYVYSIIADAASIADISVGDYIGISAVAGPLNELQADSALPPNPHQEFKTGGTVAVNVQVIPEPATVGLMGIAGLGLFLARRKARI